MCTFGRKIFRKIFEKWSELEFGQNRFFEKNEKFWPINFSQAQNVPNNANLGSICHAVCGNPLFRAKCKKVRFLTKKFFFEKTRFSGSNARNFPLVTPDVFGQFFSLVLGLQKTGFDAKIDRVLFARSTPKNRVGPTFSKTRVGTRQKWSKKSAQKSGFRKKFLKTVFKFVKFRPF
jgi:hypothetical protein